MYEHKNIQGLLGQPNPNYRSLHMFIVQVHAAMRTMFQNSGTKA